MDRSKVSIGRGLLGKQNGKLNVERVERIASSLPQDWLEQIAEANYDFLAATKLNATVVVLPLAWAPVTYKDQKDLASVKSKLGLSVSFGIVKEPVASRNLATSEFEVLALRSMYVRSDNS